MAVITVASPVPLADEAELCGGIVGNAVWRVYNCQMTRSTAVSENAATSKFEGGQKQQDGPVLQFNGSHVMQHSHGCQ